MSGPIVRTGTNPKFWDNWDKIFGDAKPATKAAKPAPKATAKADTKKVAKKDAKKKK